MVDRNTLFTALEDYFVVLSPLPIIVDSNTIIFTQFNFGLGKRLNEQGNVGDIFVALYSNYPVVIMCSSGIEHEELGSIFDRH